jgi:hypothetical protein
MEQQRLDSSVAGPSLATNMIDNSATMPSMVMGNGLGQYPVVNRDYYQSPTSTETTSTESAIQPHQRRGHFDVQNGGPLMENTGLFPEYKH